MQNKIKNAMGKNAFLLIRRGCSTTKFKKKMFCNAGLELTRLFCGNTVR